MHETPATVWPGCGPGPPPSAVRSPSSPGRVRASRYGSTYRCGDGVAIRVLIVDDHPVVREGLRAVLAAEAEIEVVGETGNGEEAVQLAADLGPDVVLMDLRLPGIDGVEA